MTHVYSIATDREEDKNNMNTFLQKLDDTVNGNEPFSIVLDDPLDNSFIQIMENETQLQYETYQRTQEQTGNALLL